MFLFIAILVTGTLAALIEKTQVVNGQVKCSIGQDVVTISAATDSIFRISFEPKGVLDPPTSMLNPKFIENGKFSSVDTTGATITVKLSTGSIVITKNPFNFKFVNNSNKELVKTYNDSGFNSTQCRFRIFKKPYYGISTGKGFPHKLDPYRIDIREAVFHITAGAQGYGGAPFIWGVAGVGLLFDTDNGHFRLLDSTLYLNRFTYTESPTTNPSIKARRAANVMYIIPGSPLQIMKGYYTLTGVDDMPPLWSLGFMNSQWGINQTSFLSYVKTYREKKIPLDCFIFDYDWMNYRGDNWGDFRWSGNFPDGATGRLKAIADSLGVKMIGIRKPRLSINTIQGREAQNNGFLGLISGCMGGSEVQCIDFYKPGAKEWYWQAFIRPEYNTYEKGIVGYWNDEGDYGEPFNFMYWQQGQYEGQRSLNNQRVFSLNRNYFAGSQRFGYCKWSGDIGGGFTQMSWQTTNMLLSASMGNSWWTMDIGGFNYTPTPSNYYRWMQFGAFVPFYRVHASRNLLRQPWVFGPEAEEIASKFIRLRYSLLPYIYSAFYRLHDEGVPVVRPLVMDFPDDNNTFTEDKSWMFGENMFISPIFVDSVKSKTFYLPAGNWYSFWDDSEFQGGKAVTMNFDSNDKIPVLVKQGAIIPMRPSGNFTSDTSALKNLSFHIYRKGSTTFNYYEDDYNTYDYEKGVRSKIAVIHTSSENTERVQVTSSQGSFTPQPKRGAFVFHSFTIKPQTVQWNGENVPEIVAGDSVKVTNKAGWWYDNNSKVVNVYVSNVLTPQQITISHGVVSVESDLGSKTPTQIYHSVYRNKLRIETHGLINGSIQIQIFTPQGQSVYKSSVKSGEFIHLIEMSKFAKGYYICTLRNKYLNNKFEFVN